MGNAPRHETHPAAPPDPLAEARRLLDLAAAAPDPRPFVEAARALLRNAPAPAQAGPDDGERVMRAVEDLGRGAGAKGLVRIAALRRALPDLPRERLDGALFALSSTGRLRLLSVTDPARETREDLDGAIKDDLRGRLFFAALPHEKAEPSARRATV